MLAALATSASSLRGLPGRAPGALRRGLRWLAAEPRDVVRLQARGRAAGRGEPEPLAAALGRVRGALRRGRVPAGLLRAVVVGLGLAVPSVLLHRAADVSVTAAVAIPMA